MGNWFGDESDPWNQWNESDDATGLDDVMGLEEGDDATNHAGPDGVLGMDDVAGLNDDPVEAIADVPADAFNAATGTGENLGWFGVVDRKLDPRSWDGEQPDWAEPADWNDGISGFFAGATQAGGHVAGEAASGAGQSLWRQPKVLALVSLVVLAVLGPYAEMLATAGDAVGSDDE